MVTQADASQNDFQQFSIATQDEGQSAGVPSTIDVMESQTEPDLNFQDDEEMDMPIPAHACKWVQYMIAFYCKNYHLKDIVASMIRQKLVNARFAANGFGKKF